MPISPQIVITPDDIVFKSFAISAVSYTSTTATYTATGHTLSAGNIVQITGLSPDGYNGTYTISSVATNTFTVANTTNTALTDQVGNAYWADPTEYEYDGGQTVAFIPNDADVNDLIDTNATVAAAAAQAQAAATAAGNAQTTANTALTNAATAYNAAIGSLQPSANTIVNASNQMTAIAANGITVYSGASSSSGARVVLNSTGLAGFNSGGTATFSISASTGAAVFSGSVTGSTITGGTLNIAGNAIIDASGLLTATGATITGTINATAGYFGTATNGFSINSTGLVGVGGGVISGGIITTSTGSNAVVLDGPNNALGIKNGGTYAGWLLGIGSGAFMMHYGTSPSVTGYPRTSVSSTTASLAADGSNSISITTSGNNMQGAMTFGGTVTLNNQTNYPGVATGSGTSMVLVSTGSRIAIVTSSERFKQEVKYVNTTGWLDKVLAMKPITYKTDVDFTTPGEPNELQYGFLAEDINDLGGGLEKTVIFDPLGDPFSLSYDRLTVFLVLAIKELKAEIEQLKGNPNGTA